jgi:hypothetical protein
MGAALPRLGVRRFQSLGELLVHAVVYSSFEAQSIARLAALRRMTVRTLQRRCRDAETTAKACIDFVRCLQLVLDTTVQWDPAAQLSICTADARTIKRIVASGGLKTSARPSLDSFLRAQRLIASEAVLNDVRSGLAATLTRVA